MPKSPMDLFIKAHESFKHGDKKEAALLLSRATGIEKLAPVIRASLRDVFEDNTKLGKAVRFLVSHEESKQWREDPF